VSLAVRRKLFGNKHPAVASSLNSLAYAFCFQGRLVEAEAVAREALAVCKELFGNEHPNVANALDTLATVTWHEGKRDEAETAEREALAMTRKLLGYENADVAQMMDNLAAMVCSQGRLSEAENLAREGLRMRKDLLGKEEQRFSWQEGLGAARSKSPTLEPVASAWEVAISINNLGGILGHEGELTQAESLLGEALTMRRKLAGDNNVLVSKSLANLLEVLERQGKLGVSEELARECLAICEKTSPDNWLIFSSQSVLGGSLLAQKRFSEAEPLLLAGYEGLKQRRAYDLVQCEPYLQRALQRLTLLYEATGRSEQAGQWRAETTKWRRQEVAKYRKAADVGDIGARSVLARLLATCEAAEIRDGPTAVAFAEAAVAATKRKNPNILDTLAATYAETGQFQKAVAIQKEVLAINSNPTLAKDFESHLKSYESGKPWRE
jgi:tetratricopeptide (TPR) repeat protein